MRKKESKFVTKFISEIGTKKRNNDYFGYVQLDNYAIWIITDGVGEESDGGIASKLAVEAGVEYFMQHPRFNTEVLQEIVNYVNMRIIEKQKQNEKSNLMQTSFLVVITNYNSILYANVGNTRLYLIRNGYIEKQSMDDTVAYLLVQHGSLSKNDVRFHRQRNDLLQALGDYSKIKPFILKTPIELQEKDSICLATIGFWENLSEEEIENKIQKNQNREALIVEVEKKLLDVSNEKVDNYTFAIIDILKVATPEPEEKNKKSSLKKYIIFVLLFLTIFLGIIIYNRIKYEKLLSEAKKYEKLSNDDIIKRKFIAAVEDLELANGEYEKLIKKKDSIFLLISGINKKKKIAESNFNLNSKKKKDILELEKAFKVYMEGDNLYKINDYDNALKKYQEAKFLLQSIEIKKDELKINEILSKLNLKINASIKLKEAMLIVASGDKAIEASNPKLAKEYYEKAMDIFLENQREDYVSELERKLNQISEAQKTEYTKAMLLENQGDMLGQTSPRNSRNEYYKARVIYQKIGDTVKAEEIDNKIQMLNSKQLAELQSAKELVQEGLNALSNSDSSGAIVLFNKAKNIYDKMEDKNNSKSVDNYISQAKNMIVVSDKNDKEKEKMELDLKNKEEELKKQKENEEKEKERKKEIDKKIDKAVSLEGEGDELQSTERYSESVQKYDEALEKYNEIQDESDVSKKENIKQLEMKKLKSETYLYKKQGDDAVDKKKWKEAVRKYSKAKENISKIDVEDSFKEEIDDKLKKAIKKSGKKWWQFWK